MEHYIWAILAAAVLICVVWGVVRHAVRKKTPNSRTGDYTFDSQWKLNFDAFPYLILPQDSKKLKILLLADPQLKLGAMPHRDRKTLKLIKKAIAVEQPDLCVVTGDLALSVFTLEAYRHFAKFMKKQGVKWAFVFGNHDAQFDCSKHTLCRLLKKFDNCLFAEGADNIHGKGNYLVNIFRGEKLPQNLVYSLVMLDSGMYPENASNCKGDVYDCVHQDQIDWYCAASRQLKQQNPSLQTMMFFHIPVKQFADMYYADRLEKGFGIPQEVDVMSLKPTHDVTGVMCESFKKPCEVVDKGYDIGIFYQGKEAGAKKTIFDAAKAQGNNSAIVCGHDHVNTLKGFYDGIYLAYGLCCGYHTYPYFKRFPSRKITLNGNLWRDENGNKLEKGVTVIEIDLSDENYGKFVFTDKFASEFFSPKR